MHPQTGWLSQDAHALQRKLQGTPQEDELHCDVLVVGSGYGGAVAAARLAATALDGTPLKIMVVERGREYLPGMFPSRAADVPGHVRFSRQDGKRPRGPATALWDMRLGDDVNVVLGSGLGGGSLVNAAVMERPEATVWQNGWPSGLDGDVLTNAYATASGMLQANPLPAGQTLKKLEALQHLGDGLADQPQVERCHIAVAFDKQKTVAGVVQQACNQCGDCATGCNWQAKNSLDANYLALAKQRGADLYCGVLARRIVRYGPHWMLEWSPMDDTLEWGKTALAIRARFLIVCAGSLGSTELLQRSQSGEPDSASGALGFSAALGSRFSTNGDMIAAAVKLPIPTQICADEMVPANTEGTSRDIGPTITGMLRSGTGAGRFTVQEFAIPAPLRRLLAEIMGSIGMLQDMPRHDWSLHSPLQRGAEPLSQSDEAIHHTMVYGLMGDDGARGRLEPTRTTDKAPLDAAWDARIAVQWPEARHEAVFNAQHDALAGAYSAGHRGWYLPNPAWRPLPQALDQLARGKGVRGPTTTVHPLGGCPMADTVEDGVVDRWGRVFDPNAADAKAVFHGLVVLDGAIIPRALGINPALTIAAIAEHAISKLVEQWKLTPRNVEHLPALTERPTWEVPKPRPEQPSTAIRLLEQLQGTLELAGHRYWGELQVRFAPIEDVVAFTRTLPRRAAFEHVVLRLYPDRLDRDDEPQWRAQREVDVPPLWEVRLSGHAHVMFRHWSWWGSRVWSSFGNVGRSGAAGASLDWWTKLAIASNLGERRGLDYLLHVDSVSGTACPLQPGDLLRGRKVLENTLDSNPWRQVSEMELQWSPKAVIGARYRKLGDVMLDLRYFVRQRTVLLALHGQADMATALVDLSTLGLFCLRVLLKIQLLKFVPPDKKPRDTVARRPAELPGLTIEHHDKPARKVLLTRYRNQIDPQPGPPILLIHGFTASGSTFAHPSIPTNLVQYLCGQHRDVWVVDLPTSIAFDKSDAKDMGFEEVAQVIPDIVRLVTMKTQQEKIDILGHCIGSAMFCYAVLSDADLHASVRSLTLSQVGPLIQMSQANQLRGYVASYLAEYLGTETLDARPDFASGAASSLGQTLLDALLASLPYPAHDQERRLAEKAMAQGRPDFRVVRHRSDAMLGRLLELTDDSPVAPATLDALDDILGYARVQTLAQIIHYTRLSMLADSGGRNRLLTSDALSTRMDFPVLLLHGRRSGVFDWRGSLESYEWLRRSYEPTSELLPTATQRDGEKLHLGLDTDRQLCVFEKFGHQDSMVGSRAAAVVFPVIASFLNRPLRPATAVAAAATTGKGQPASVLPTPWVAKLPATGPIVGWLRDAAKQGEVNVSLVLHPSAMHARTRYVAVVPMRYLNGQWQEDKSGRIKLVEDLQAPAIDVTGPWGYLHGRVTLEKLTQLWSSPSMAHLVAAPLAGTFPKEPNDPISRADITKDIGNSLRTQPLTLRIKTAQAACISTALLFLTVHNDLPERSGNGRIASNDDPLLWDRWTKLSKFMPAIQKHALGAVRQFLNDPPANLEAGLLRLPDHVLQARDRANQPPTTPRSDSLTFAVGSCQYPAGLLDNELAQSSYRRLAARLDGPPGDTRPVPQLLLLLGDQVYVDATAGLFDPVTQQQPFDQIYNRSFTMPAFRAVTSRLPTFMVVDDHEVKDNWQPMPRDGTTETAETKALDNYFYRQSVLNPSWLPTTTATDSFSFSLLPGGWPLYVLDTRTQRELRTPETFDTAKIVPDKQMAKLLTWLKMAERACPGCPKFIASASVLLPFERSLEQQPCWSSDGWAGYPASRAQLLRWIVRLKMPNVIFLAGDAHMSMASVTELAWGGRPPVRIYSVVSSGLYAPWRFANDAPCNYILDGAVALDVGNGQVLNGKIQSTARQTNGFAIVHVQKDVGSQSYVLTVEFDPAHGVAPIRYQL